MYLDSIRIWSLSLLGCSLGQWQDSSVTMGTSVFRGGLVYSNLSPHAAGDIQCDKVTKVVENGNIWKPFSRLCRHSRCWNCTPDGPDGKRQIQLGINVYYTMRWESCLIVLLTRRKVQLLLFVRESQWQSDAEHCRTNSRSGHECKGLPFGKYWEWKRLSHLSTSYHPKCKLSTDIAIQRKF